MTMKRVNAKRLCVIAGILGLFVIEAGTQVLEAQATVSQRGAVTVLTIPGGEAQVGGGIDFVNAAPMKLPSAPGRSTAEARQDLINTLTSPVSVGQPGHSIGAEGDGTMHVINLGVPAAASFDDIGPLEFGANNHLFSTAQADLASN